MKGKEIRQLVRQAIIEKFEKDRNSNLQVMSEKDLRAAVRKKLQEGVVSKILEK